MMGCDVLAGADPAVRIIADHASAAVPDDVSLGVPADVMATHIAVDIGVAPLATAIGRALAAPVHLGAWSRLVVDTNRPAGHPEAVPATSDGIAIPGNQGLSPEAHAARLRIHRAFHDALDRDIAAHPPALLVSIHSFTPVLASCPAPRPWPVALLWNRDDRAVGPALAVLRADASIPGPIGLNEPYSGQLLNYTMDRHAEARGIPYLGFEVRQDLLGDDAGVARWADILVPAIRAARAYCSVTV